MSDLPEQMINKIDNYLTGNLSPIESTQFESELASNVALQEEVEFQSEIIDSIKEYKRLELKSRLNKIKVSTKSKWFGKIAITGIAASVTIATIGLFYYEYTKFDINPIYTARDKQIISNYEEYTHTEPEVLNLNTEEQVEVREEFSPIIEEEKTIDLTDVSAPNLSINDSEDRELTNNPLETIEDLESVSILSSGGANVEIEFKKGKKIAYKFFDQKLFLFGKFNKSSPYEVIEIKTQFGKEFYLKFDNSYYTIKKGVVDKTPLIKIDNNRLIKKLNNLE